MKPFDPKILQMKVLRSGPHTKRMKEDLFIIKSRMLYTSNNVLKGWDVN